MNGKLPRRLRRNRQVDGWTLIELVLTITLAALLSIPMAAFIAGNIENQQNIEDVSTALHVARREMEDVYRQTLSDAGYLALASASSQNYQGSGFSVERVVAYAVGNQFSTISSKEVTVTVRRDGESEVLAEFITYITRDVQYGV